MTKSKTTYEVWTGHDTFGRAVEVARRTGADTWYCRFQVNTRYGVRLSAWTRIDPDWHDTIPAPEMASDPTPIKVAPFIAWGFQRLRRIDSPENTITELRPPKKGS